MPKKVKSVFSSNKAASTSKASSSTQSSAPAEVQSKGKKSATEQLDHYDRNVSSTARARVRHNERMASPLNQAGRCMRKSLIILNILFICSGFAVMVYGAYAYSEQLAALTGSQWAILSLSIGTVIMVIAIVGILGAKYELRLFLILYLFLVVCAWLMTFVAGAYLLSKEGHEGDFVTSGWNAASNSLRITLENTYSCCGFMNFNDSHIACPPNTSIPCYNSLVAAFKSHYNSFGITAILLAIFLMLAGLLTYLLFRQLNNSLNVRVEMKDQP